MDIDVAGRIRNVQLSASKPLLPLFEAVINSIQAIEDASVPNGKIDIQILRDESSLFSHSDQQLADAKGFIITDSGIAHLGRFIDKIRPRNAGKIQDYNYITVGFDKYPVDFLKIDPKAFEQRVLAGGTDEELLAWVRTHGRQLSDQEIVQWSQGLLMSGPKDDAARQRFQGRLQEIATKRGVPVTSLPPVTTWADVIELDEGRM